jgi:hypothetical protein
MLFQYNVNDNSTPYQYFTSGICKLGGKNKKDRTTRLLQKG